MTNLFERRFFKAKVSRASTLTVAICIAILLGSCLLCPPTAAADAKSTRRILIINDLGVVSSPGFAEVDQAVFTGLQKSPYQIEFYYESLEITLFPSESSQKHVRDELIKKYSDRKPDMIIAIGSESLKFTAESHEKFFRDTPIIFCAVLEIPDSVIHHASFTGVLGSLHPERTLDAALHLLPGTKHVVVDGGSGTFDVGFENIAKQAFREYESKLEFTYLTDLPMAALLEKLRHLPKNTIVYHTAITRDASGERFIDSTQALPMVANVANAPVFVMDDVDLVQGKGATIGGDLVNWANDGGIAAEMAVRVLKGESPQDIPIVTSQGTYMFDWRALRRWGMNENHLPPGSIVLNREPSVWELYRRYFLAGILVLLGQSAAIIGLLWQRARRRRSEAELRKSEHKFSKSFRESPLSISIISTKGDRYIDVNEAFERQTGWKRDEVLGRTPLDLGLVIDAAQRAQFMSQVVAEGSVREFEVEFRKKNGQVRTAVGSAELIEIEGSSCALSIFADITERKAAEEALVSLSGRLIEAQEEERKRVAREIHDDYQQRLAVIAIDLEELRERIGDSLGDVGTEIEGVWNRTCELGIDLHSLSHRLHSSTLENLGLVDGIKNFCTEYSQQHEMQIEFVHNNVPHSISSDVSLCLFRITQEAIRNVKRHSGAARAEVGLECVNQELRLSISDRGKGIDPNKPIAEQGIGIQSMKERLRLLGGVLEIQSLPSMGTSIEARLPLNGARGEGKSGQHVA